MLLKPEILDEILKDYKNPEDLMRQEGIIKTNGRKNFKCQLLI
jgi:hypothetical protein